MDCPECGDKMVRFFYITSSFHDFENVSNREEYCVVDSQLNLRSKEFRSIAMVEDLVKQLNAVNDYGVDVDGAPIMHVLDWVHYVHTEHPHAKPEEIPNRSKFDI